MKKKSFSVGNLIGLLFCLAVWALMLHYGWWYLRTGWSEQNAIMKYCSQFASHDVGWFKYIFHHGILNFVAGYLALFPFALPIIILIQIFKRKSFSQIVGKCFSLLFSLMFNVALIAGLLYGADYLMAEQPLIAGLLLIIGIGCLVPTAKGVWVIVISD